VQVISLASANAGRGFCFNVPAPAAKAAGLGEKIGWRTFRRTYSSLLRKLGVDIKVQQELMRHADIRTTLDLYTEPFSDDVRRANGNVVQMVLKEAAVS